MLLNFLVDALFLAIEDLLANKDYRECDQYVFQAIELGVSTDMTLALLSVTKDSRHLLTEWDSLYEYAWSKMLEEGRSDAEISKILSEI